MRGVFKLLLGSLLWVVMVLRVFFISGSEMQVLRIGLGLGWFGVLWFSFSSVYDGMGRDGMG